MALFKGQAEYSVDGKGRVALPAKMRRAVNPEAKDTFTITRGYERYIAVFPLDHWEQVEEKLRNLNHFKRKERAFVRDLLRWADEITLDAQGRLTIPKILLNYAGITERAAIIGNGDHLEIWNPDTLNEHAIDDLDTYQELAEQVMGDLDL